MTMPRKIDRLYAWVCTEADGSEGIAAHTVPGLGTLPLIGADKARIESLRSCAQAVFEATGCPTVLKVFTGGQVIDSLTRAAGEQP